jgi:tripartite-type tricarboxylate transporter receptor subunit TctC
MVLVRAQLGGAAMPYTRPLRRPLLLFGAFVLAFSISVLAGVRAADYPSRAITLVVWTSPGGPLDLSMRRLASLMEPHLGQPVVVENRPGGNGAVAMAFVRSQPADGYTLLSVTSSLAFASAKGEVPFKLSDFRFLRMIEAEPSAIAVRKDSPLNSGPPGDVQTTSVMARLG